MSKYVYIRPAPAPTEDEPEARRHVRDPLDGSKLPPEGKEVLWDTFWARRLVDEDIEIADPAPAKAEEAQDGGEETPAGGKTARRTAQPRD